MLNPYRPRPIDLYAEVPLDTNADLSVLDDAKVLAAPDDPASWPLWREQLARWRHEATERIGYDGSRYAGERGDCFVVGLTWLWDERLYNHDTGRFTVDAYLAAAQRDFGGFDGVVLWHAYPIIGIDCRTQFDFYRDVAELPSVIRQLHAHDVRAFVVVYPWEPASPDNVADLVEWSGADGVFVDAVREGAPELRKALDALRPGIPMEAESRVPLLRMHDHSMSWAQWFADSAVPGVLRAKWFERRHMLHHVRRWNRSHLEELQSAWINGTGIMVWESVFGVWVGWSARDRSLLRAMRRVHREYAPWLRSDQWTPLADYAGGDVYASRREHDGIPLWTVVNRGGEQDGPWFITSPRPGWHWTEVATGVPLRIEEIGGQVQVGGAIAADGIAAVVATREPVGAVSIDIHPDTSFPRREAVRLAAAPAPREAIPDGMAAVTPGRYELTVHHRVRETGLYGEAPYVDEWKPLPPRLHNTGTLQRNVCVGRIAIERLEVSNTQFAAFLDATGYEPLRPERFIEHWPGLPDAPVTHVDLADARAYASWAGMRVLPRTSGRWPPTQGLSIGGHRWCGISPRASTRTAEPGSAFSRAAASTAATGRTGISTAARSRPMSR